MFYLLVVVGAVYNGGPNYIGNSSSVEFNVHKNESELLVEVDPIQVGQGAVVYVTVKAVDENSKAIPQNYVVVTVGGKTANVPLTYETGAGYAVGRYVFNGITYGSHNVTATYTSGINYGSSSNNTVNLVVNRNASDVIIEVENVRVGQNATVYVFVKAHDDNSVAIPQGTVNITVNGKTYPVRLSDDAANKQAKGNVTIDVLPAETYSVVADYLGGPNYLGNSNTSSVRVIKNESQVTLTVSDVFVGQNATVYVTVSAVDSNSKAHPQGTVTLRINEDLYEIELSNSTDGKSVGQKTVKLYPYGNYIVSASYSSGPNYSLSYTPDRAYSFNVIKNASKVDVYVAGVKVGQNAVVYVNVSAVEATSVAIPQGNVTVTVGGKTYTIILSNAVDGNYATGSVVIDPLDARSYTVYATYNSGPNYNASTNNTFKFNVGKNESAITVEVAPVQVGQKAVVYVNVTHAADSVAIPQGNVTITVAGIDKSYTIFLEDADGYATGSVTLDVIPAGDYGITAVYNSGPNYNGATNIDKVLSVLKNQSQVTVYVDSYVRVGQIPTVSVIVKSLIDNSDAAIPQGNVTISVNGKEYTIILSNDTENNQAVGSTPIDVLTAGTWVVGAVYNGGPNYIGNSSSTEFIVHKNESSVSVVVADVQVGQRAVVYVNVTHESESSKAIPQGNVTFDVNGKTYIVVLHNATDGDYATGSITLDELPYDARGYEFIAYYQSGPNYGESNSPTMKFKVNKNTTSMDLIVSDVLVETNNTISVKVLSNSTTPTGKVTIVVGGKQYNITLENGEGSTTIDQLPWNNGQKYRVVAEYLGDENYESIETDNTFVVNRYDNLTLQILSVGEGYHVGVENIILISANTDRLTGKLHIVINGTVYDQAQVGNNFVLTTDKDKLLAGSHLIVADYYGDDLFAPAHAEKTVVFNKWDSSLNVEATNAYVGEDVYVRVNVTVTGMENRHATGDVHIVVDGKDYTITLDDEGKGSQDISGLSAKTGYIVTASYDGDNYFKSSVNNSATFDVYKRNTNVTVTADPITYLENATVNVVVYGDSNGTASNLSRRRQAYGSKFARR